MCTQSLFLTQRFIHFLFETRKSRTEQIHSFLSPPFSVWLKAKGNNRTNDVPKDVTCRLSQNLNANIHFTRFYCPCAASGSEKLNWEYYSFVFAMQADRNERYAHNGWNEICCANSILHSFQTKRWTMSTRADECYYQMYWMEISHDCFSHSLSVYFHRSQRTAFR